MRSCIIALVLVTGCVQEETADTSPVEDTSTNVPPEETGETDTEDPVTEDTDVVDTSVDTDTGEVPDTDTWQALEPTALCNGVETELSHTHVVRGASHVTLGKLDVVGSWYPQRLQSVHATIMGDDGQDTWNLNVQDRVASCELIQGETAGPGERAVGQTLGLSTVNTDGTVQFNNLDFPFAGLTKFVVQCQLANVSVENGNADQYILQNILTTIENEDGSEAIPWGGSEARIVTVEDHGEFQICSTQAGDSLLVADQEHVLMVLDTAAAYELMSMRRLAITLTGNPEVVEYVTISYPRMDGSRSSSLSAVDMDGKVQFSSLDTGTLDTTRPIVISAETLSEVPSGSHLQATLTGADLQVMGMVSGQVLLNFQTDIVGHPLTAP